LVASWTDGFPEERIRRQRHDSAAEVAKALHDVVHVRRLVLGMTGERYEVVQALQLVTGLDRLEVVVGEELGRLAGQRQPAETGCVVAVEAGRYSALAVRPVEDDGRVAPGVPRVAEAVAVGIVEVVSLPGVGRHDDHRPRLAELLRPDDERSEAGAAV